MDAKTLGQKIASYGLNLEVWKNCADCGGCVNSRKIKCQRAGGYELQVLYNKGVWKIFKNGKVIHAGRVEYIKEQLDKIVL